MTAHLLIAAVLFGTLGLAFGDPPAPVELGDVPWVRDFDEATAKSRASGRPILLLFQEVPG